MRSLKKLVIFSLTNGQTVLILYLGFEKVSNYIKVTAHTGGLTQGGDGWQKKKEVEHVRVQAEKPPEQKPSTTQ